MKSMHISMRLLMPLAIGRSITVLGAITFMRVSSDLALKIRDRIFQSVQFATKHVKLSSAKGNRSSARCRWLKVPILNRSHKRRWRWRILLNILPLVGRMIRAKLRMVAVSTRLTRP